MVLTHCLQVDSNRWLVEASCTCAAGVKGTCKHAFALYSFINSDDDDSRTSKPKLWGVGSKQVPDGSKEVVGDVVLKKEEKKKVAEVPLDHLIHKHLINLNSPFVQIYKAQNKQK